MGLEETCPGTSAGALGRKPGYVAFAEVAGWTIPWTAEWHPCPQNPPYDVFTLTNGDSPDRTVLLVPSLTEPRRTEKSFPEKMPSSCGLPPPAQYCALY